MALAFSWAAEEGGAAPAVCARGDCHGYALTKQMALLPAGHLSSHCNVGIEQAAAGATGAGLGAGALPRVPPAAALGWGCGQQGAFIQTPVASGVR